MRLPRGCTLPVRAASSSRHFSASVLCQVARRSPKFLLREEDRLDVDFEADFEDEPIPNDTSSAGHILLQQQRQTLYYMRLIEHEMPKLVAFRKPFNPPPLEATPLVVRSISYGGEEHPASVKRSIVVPVSKLPLKNDIAIHKMKLLAGVRWSPEPPRDAGISPSENAGDHGYIKISCEDFPKPAMNLKWVSDTLDRLIDEANNNERFADIPLDTRHLDAKAQKTNKGGRGAQKGRHPSIRDFPQEWLPSPRQIQSAPPQAASTA
ncbi:hypothetical protein GLOTRDRAFT_52863 [Gloeophyllum trabeum ATCC 11539]|uniref:Small ribosomal subunit protein mS35 mitochondrial conserved domain-containing protein n=1 Tax=Gloeophyllum trabeum (strain ATCC 11539 / FP-39264 / Madison 617) TaxID=670483 RepID=S7QME0_GLOTA|nr:uncharacterized protein GLOTRDRAFT_52863 [Gloeophyllum trabeum ATCC 11539]EPQ60567.1 hypothetical protein GLOTRDRAFT_52863 [Gloeophyllum trabeum ATCC 11539]